MDATKTARWNIRVTPAQDAAVRALLERSGESLNDFVARHACIAAEMELADRRVFLLDEAAWTELTDRLDRAPMRKPALAKLLSKRSVLD